MPRNYNRDVEMKRSDRMYKKSYDENMKEDGFANRSGNRTFTIKPPAGDGKREFQYYYGNEVTRDSITTSKATKMLKSTKNMTRDNISKNRTRMRKQTASKKK